MPFRARSQVALLAATAAMLLGLGAAWWLAKVRPPDPLDIALAQLGHERYRVDLRGRVVGSYETETRRSADRLILASTLRTRLPGAQAIEVGKRLEFATEPPYALLRATQERITGGRSTRVLIQRRGNAYAARVERGNDRSERELGWNYTLADHLAVERWLRSNAVLGKDEHSARQLDFAELRPVVTGWRLLETTAAGETLLAHAAGGSSALLFLGPDLVPRAMSLGGVFTLSRLPAGASMPVPGPLTHTRLAMVPLSEPLPHPAELTRVRLALNAEAAEALRAALPVTRASGGWWLDLEERAPRPATVAEIRRAGEATVDLPADHPRLGRMAQRAIADATSADARVERLTRFVHDWLDYRSDLPTASLFDALDRRTGDCTEFADLLTSLARASGMPARTVFGLAYAEEDGPGFYLHAWTEIAVDDRWRAVDPTFGRLHVGPTHIPFPDSDAGYLRTYAAIPKMRFEVVATEYQARTESTL